jgi:hypothetical protein
MPPFWQYFSPLLRGRRVHCCPKERGPPDAAAFRLQTAAFKGPPEGAMIAMLDPRATLMPVRGLYT